MKVAYNFKAGQAYRYHCSSTMNGTMTMGSGPAFPLKVETTADSTWKVVSLDPSGNATIDLTLSNLKVSSTSTVLPGTTTSSTTTTTTDQHFQFQVTPNGETLSGGGPSPSPCPLPAGQGPAPPGTDQFLAILPGRAVKPGDTWTKTFTKPSLIGPGSTTYTTENRFLRYDDLPTGRAAVIQTTATIPVNGSLGSPSGGTVSVQGTYSTSTTTWFDVKTDQVRRMETVDDVDETTDLSGITGLPSPPPGFQAPPGLPSPPPGVPVPTGLPGLLGPQHLVGKQTFRLDLA